MKFLKKLDRKLARADAFAERYLTWFCLALMVSAIFVLLITLIPSLHGYFYPAHAGNTVYVLEVARCVLEEKLSEKYDTEVCFTPVQPGQRISFKNIREQSKRQIKYLGLDSTMYESISNPDSLRAIWIIWLEKYGVATISYFYAHQLDENGKIDTAYQDRIFGYPMIYLRYESPEMNLGQQKEFFELFAKVNQEAFPDLNADSLYQKTVYEVNYYLDHLLEYRWNRIRLGGGLFVLLMVLYLLWGFAKLRIVAFKKARGKYLSIKRKKRRIRNSIIVSFPTSTARWAWVTLKAKASEATTPTFHEKSDRPMR